MNFDLTQDQRDLLRSVREFAKAEIQPHIMEWDEAQTFPTEVVKKLGGLGVLGAPLPEELGGAGLSAVDNALLIEELARVDPSVALIVAAHSCLCANHINLHGSDEQRRKYLPKLATGAWIGCWSLTEPSAGSDAASTSTTGTLDGDHWVLNGTKVFTTNAQQADVCVMSAVTDPERSSHGRGISCFIVERGTEGFSTGRKENKLGMRASDTGEIIFSGCRVPRCQLIGHRGHGFADVKKVLESGRVGIAALGVGIAQGAYEAAVSYSQERHQFGRKIADFQLIKQKLADMATEIEASRLLTLKAASLLDQGRPFAKAASMAKLFSSETAVRVANEGVQVHGGYGFTKDYPAEKFYRDAKLMTIGEGTSEIQRLVIARAILHGEV